MVGSPGSPLPPPLGFHSARIGKLPRVLADCRVRCSLLCLPTGSELPRTEALVGCVVFLLMEKEMCHSLRVVRVQLAEVVWLLPPRRPGYQTQVFRLNSSHFYPLSRVLRHQFGFL